MASSCLLCAGQVHKASRAEFGPQVMSFRPKQLAKPYFGPPQFPPPSATFGLRQCKLGGCDFPRSISHRSSRQHRHRHHHHHHEDITHFFFPAISVPTCAKREELICGFVEEEREREREREPNHHKKIADKGNGFFVIADLLYVCGGGRGGGGAVEKEENPSLLHRRSPLGAPLCKHASYYTCLCERIIISWACVCM